MPNVVVLINLFNCMVFLLQDCGGVAARLPHLGGIQWAATSHVLPSLTGKGRQFSREVNIPKIIVFSSFS